MFLTEEYKNKKGVSFETEILRSRIFTRTSLGIPTFIVSRNSNAKVLCNIVNIIILVELCLEFHTSYT